MSYMNKYDPEKFKEIEDVLLKIQDLSPGARLSLSNFDCEEGKQKMRWLLYNWMYHNQLKQYYRIRQFPNELEIVKLGGFGNVRVDRKDAPLGARLDMIITDMIKSTDEESAIQVARTKRDEGHITSEEFGIVMEKYGDVMK